MKTSILGITSAMVIGLMSMTGSPPVSAKAVPTHGSWTTHSVYTVSGEVSSSPLLLSGQTKTSPTTVVGGGGGSGSCGATGDSNTGWAYYTAPDDSAQLGICSYQVPSTLTMVTDWSLTSFDGPISWVKMAASWTDGYVDPNPETQYPSPNTIARDQFEHTFSKSGTANIWLTGSYVLTYGEDGTFNEEGIPLYLN